MVQLGMISVRQIGNTIYIVRSLTSSSANETAYEKVRRLIMDGTKKDADRDL